MSSHDPRHPRNAAYAANHASYRDPATVGSYIGRPYHAIRRDLATEAMTTMLDRTPCTGPVLEVGSAGDSMLGALLTQRRLIAADIEADALATVKGARVCLDVEAPLPFADGSLAGVLIGELIEHLFDPVRAVTELARVLAPGGVLVITTPNLATVQDRLRFLLGRSPRQVDAAHPYLRLHIRPFTASSLRRLLTEAGFVVETLRSNMVGWELPSGRWLESGRLARWFPSMGGSLVMGARRSEVV